MGVILKSLMPAYGGYTIARDERVIFIKGAIPGEIVEVAIEEKKRDYAIASAIHIVEPSEDRVEPKCDVFGVCGGCQLQYITYDRQLNMKDEILRDSLTRLAGIETELEPALSDLQWNYRHRAQVKVSRQGEIGFYKASTMDVVSCKECPLMRDEINSRISRIKEHAVIQNLKEIHITVGDTPVILLKGEGYDTRYLDTYSEIGFSGIGYNDSLHSGRAYTEFDLNSLKYTISPWTFSQSHWSLNRKVVDLVINELPPLQGKCVLDLYAGAGNFSMPIAVLADEVIAVEENVHAIEDAYRNLKLNGIKNCRFVKSSAEKYRLKRRFDIMVLDPPRPGLTTEVARKILDNLPYEIVYISCNPATFGRDLKRLAEKYEIRSLRQVDFFPNTFHIEVVAFLQLK